MTEPNIRTLAELPFHVSGRFSKPVLTGRCEGDGIREWSNRQLFDEVRDLSLGLGALGVRSRDRVAILSDSRPEWVISDLATLTAGAVTVPVYPTLPANQVGYILAHSGARVVAVADEEQAAKVRAARKEAPAVEAIVIFDSGAPEAIAVEPVAPAADAPPAAADAPAEDDLDGGAADPAAGGRQAADAAGSAAGSPEAGGSEEDAAETGDGETGASGADAESPLREYSLAEIMERGHHRLMTEDGLGRIYKERAHAIEPDALATIIYTSGTTGHPKGVMLSHRNFLANVAGVNQVIGISQDDTALSFLPLSHAFERTTVYMYLYNGATFIFAESLETVGRDMQQVRPTVMTGVPRVFEKLRARVIAAVAEAPRLRQALFAWATGVGHAAASARLGGRKPGLLTRLKAPIADRLVLSKIRARTGGRLRFVCSGSAPLSREVAEFLYAVGLPVLEGYGLTETAPVLTVNPLGAARIGTVGPPLARVELRIADDGEVLARGPNIMMGYYQNPDATAECIRESWFHTGDIGRIDDGYLSITDRKKEILVTAGGKNVAPQPIEALLKRDPIVAEAMLIGDRRPYVSAVLVPDAATLEQRLAASGTASGSLDDLVGRDDVRALFQPIVDEANAELAGFEQVKRFALLPAQFSIGTGELTPTLKLKRRVVMERWQDIIEGIYQDA